jgi:hypothetical protein
MLRLFDVLVRAEAKAELFVLRPILVPRASNNREALGTSSRMASTILVPRALLTRGATRGSGQIHNRIP